MDQVASIMNAHNEAASAAAAKFTASLMEKESSTREKKNLEDTAGTELIMAGLQSGRLGDLGKRLLSHPSIRKIGQHVLSQGNNVQEAVTAFQKSGDMGDVVKHFGSKVVANRLKTNIDDPKVKEFMDTFRKHIRNTAGSAQAAIKEIAPGVNSGLETNFNDQLDAAAARIRHAGSGHLSNPTDSEFLAPGIATGLVPADATDSIRAAVAASAPAPASAPAAVRDAAPAAAAAVRDAAPAAAASLRDAVAAPVAAARGYKLKFANVLDAGKNKLREAIQRHIGGGSDALKESEARIYSVGGIAGVNVQGGMSLGGVPNSSRVIRRVPTDVGGEVKAYTGPSSLVSSWKDAVSRAKNAPRALSKRVTNRVRTQTFLSPEEQNAMMDEMNKNSALAREQTNAEQRQYEVQNTQRNQALRRTPQSILAPEPEEVRAPVAPRKPIPWAPEDPEIDTWRPPIEE